MENARHSRREAHARRPRVGERPLVRADAEVVRHADRGLERQVAADRARRDVGDARAASARRRPGSSPRARCSAPRPDVEAEHRGLLVRLAAPAHERERGPTLQARQHLRRARPSIARSKSSSSGGSNDASMQSCHTITPSSSQRSQKSGALVDAVAAETNHVHPAVAEQLERRADLVGDRRPSTRRRAVPTPRRDRRSACRSRRTGSRRRCGRLRPCGTRRPVSSIVASSISSVTG